MHHDPDANEAVEVVEPPVISDEPEPEQEEEENSMRVVQ